MDKLGGSSEVAEMTGRKGRIIRKTSKGKPEYELRQSTCISDQSLNVLEVCTTHKALYSIQEKTT